MRARLYQVDAFANKPFSGNPAAVCLLNRWLPTQLMQRIANENNLSETAFLVPSDKAQVDFEIRWFSTQVEVDLCGHATLASAFVVAEVLGECQWPVRFESQSGALSVANEEPLLVLDFPARLPGKRVEVSAYAEALGLAPQEVVSDGEFAIAVFDTERAVAGLSPNMQKLAALPELLVVPSARGVDHDFVSRCFAPKSGNYEDHVTGSAHCALTPYWATVLDRTCFSARQISQRGGELSCRLEGDRVKIGGRCVLYLTGHIDV